MRMRAVIQADKSVHFACCEGELLLFILDNFMKGWKKLVLRLISDLIILGSLILHGEIGVAII
jgi:hypothetical protein